MKFLSEQLAEDDVVSVDLLVKRLRSETFSPIVFYKPQGQTLGDLNKDIFLLVIQTEFLRSMMLQFASDLVCVDGPHGMTGVDFTLMTILVPDEHHNGEVTQESKS